MADKTVFLKRTKDIVDFLSAMQEQTIGLSGVYADRGYNPGGADPITDQDLIDAGMSMTAAVFNANAIAVLGDYLAFCDGTSALPAVKRKTKLNIARSDI